MSCTNQPTSCEDLSLLVDDSPGELIYVAEEDPPAPAPVHLPVVSKQKSYPVQPLEMTHALLIDRQIRRDLESPSAPGLFQRLVNFLCGRPSQHHT